MKYLCYLLIISTFFVSGCAHRISIVPNSGKISGVNYSDKIAGTAGYYITPSLQQKEVITPAGGGDRVRYTPYKDIKKGYETVLRNVFTNTQSLDPNTPLSMQESLVDYVVSLDIKTDSSSASMFTWPPTWFGVVLETKVLNTKTKKITKISVKGEGSATYSQFIMNKGITGQEASLDALQKLQASLLSSNELKQRSVSAPTPQKVAVEKPSVISTNLPVEERLATLKKLHEQGLISLEDYKEKKSEIISSL